MGLWRKLLDAFSSGEEPPVDGDEFVDLEVVPLHRGPITIGTLEEAGIEAQAVEEFNAATAQSATMIKVRRRQHAEATALLDGLREL